MGLIPVLHERKDLFTPVSDGSRGSSGRTLGSALGVIQVSLTCALLVGSGLLVRSLWNMQAVDLGFTSQQALIASINPARHRYPTIDQRMRFHNDLLERIREIPQVSAAGAISSLPLGNSWNMAKYVGDPTGRARRGAESAAGPDVRAE